MLIRVKTFAIGLFILAVHFGVSHSMQHGLYELGVADAHAPHAEFHSFSETTIQRHIHHDDEHPQEIYQHADCDCVLGDAPYAKSPTGNIDRLFKVFSTHDVPPKLTRHATTQYSKASPRAPPALS